LLFQGQHTGALFLGDFPEKQIEFGSELSSEILKQPEQQVW
jgi:hypothetical protein